MSSPFPHGLPKLFDKNAGRIIPGRHKADGYDLFVTSYTDSAPRPSIDKYLLGASEKHEDVKQVWHLAGDDIQTG